MKKVKLYTLGCKSNQYDTQVLREKYLRQGFEESQNGLADVYVVNTCVVTQKAENDSRALVKRIEREHPSAEVILTGCLSQYQTKDSLKSRPWTDLAKEEICFFAGHHRAFLKIQDGCDNFCSYCIVPHTRGKSRSKPKDKVKEEFFLLVRNGYKEIVLTGICLGEYGKDLSPPINLGGLLKELEGINGEFRIRLSSIDPQYISSDLIETMAASKKVCPHLHIPFQSGDDAVLKTMQRSYTREFAFDLINDIKKRIPDISVTTDIIVGFPGEDETNFQRTVEFLEFLNPLKVHIFSFSPRPSTMASKLVPRIGASECRERFAILNSMQGKWRQSCLEKFIGEKISVLVENKSRQGNFFFGYSGHYFRAVFQAQQDCLNKLVEVKAVEIQGGKLICTL